METINNSIKKEINKKIAAQSALSGEIGLSSETVGEIISISARAFTVSEQSAENSASVAARAVFNVIYKGDEVENYESGMDFQLKFDDSAINEDTKGFVEYSAEDVKIFRSGAGYAVSATINAAFSFPVATETAYIEDAEGILAKKRVFRCLERVCEATGKYELEEDKEIAIPVKKVLYHDESVTITDVQCGIGTIIIDGEAFVEFVLLPFGGGEPVRENMNVQFRYEADCGAALPEMSAIARAGVEQATYKIYVDEEKGRSTITANMTIAVFGEAFRAEDRQAVEDAFSNECELSVASEEIETPVSVAVARLKDKCFGEAACDKKVDYKVKLLLDSDIVALNFSKDDGKLLIDGIIRGNLLTANAENNRAVAVAELPFSCSFDIAGEPREVSAAKRNAFAKELDGKAVIESELYFTVITAENKIAKFTASITEGAAKAEDNSAISIIFIKTGDDLWEVSKKAGIDGESLLKQNPDLTLPADKDRSIAVYRRIAL